MATEQKRDSAGGDGLDQVRAAAQELHRAISDTLAKRTSATRAEIEGFKQKAKEAVDAARSTVSNQRDARQGAMKKQLMTAIDKLEAVEEHANESLKSSGEGLHKSLTKALADARASVQKVSECRFQQRSKR